MEFGRHYSFGLRFSRRVVSAGFSLILCGLCAVLAVSCSRSATPRTGPESTQPIELAAPLESGSTGFAELKVVANASRGETIRIQGECRISGNPWPLSSVTVTARRSDPRTYAKVRAQNQPDGKVDVRLTISPHFPTGPARVNMDCSHDDVVALGSDTYGIQIVDGPIMDVDDLSTLSKTERAGVKPRSKSTR